MNRIKWRLKVGNTFIVPARKWYWLPKVMRQHFVRVLRFGRLAFIRHAQPAFFRFEKDPFKKAVIPQYVPGDDISWQECWNRAVIARDIRIKENIESGQADPDE